MDIVIKQIMNDQFFIESIEYFILWLLQLYPSYKYIYKQ